MNRSRKRQFDQFRSNASNVSIKSQTNSMHSSKVSQSNVSQACVNCVNKILAQRQRKTDKQQKQKAKADFKKSYEQNNLKVDPHNQYRQNLKKDALNYNSRLIQSQKQAKKHERQQDYKYAQKVNKNLEEAQKSLKSLQEAQKQKQNQYYQQIQNQYISEIQKKDKERFHKDKVQQPVSGLPLYNPDLSQQKLQYKKQLQRQMQQKKARQNEQKMRNKNRQKELLEQSKRQADKYHADNYESIKLSKQQVFQGLKNIEMNKKKRAQQQRKMNEQERMKQMKQQHELRSKAIKYKMEQMQKYVDGLKNQLLQKQQKLKMSKVTDRNFLEKIPKSTQEILAQHQVKKTCKSCHKNYPQELIGPIPKKA